MLAVPYFEKALYELPEEELTAERVMQVGGRAARGTATAPRHTRACVRAYRRVGGTATAP
jgi:hypothetical protein